MRKLEMSILQILTEDARTPADQIAIMLGKSEEEIRETIRRLEEQRIILKYPGFDAIAEQIYRFEEVLNVYLMSGGYDLLVMLKSQTLKKLALFVAEKLSTIDGVLSTATHFVLKRYKSQGVIMDERTEDRRLQVSP